VTHFCWWAGVLSRTWWSTCRSCGCGWCMGTPSPRRRSSTPSPRRPPRFSSSAAPRPRTGPNAAHRLNPPGGRTPPEGRTRRGEENRALSPHPLMAVIPPGNGLPRLVWGVIRSPGTGKWLSHAILRNRPLPPLGCVAGPGLPPKVGGAVACALAARGRPGTHMPSPGGGIPVGWWGQGWGTSPVDRTHSSPFGVPLRIFDETSPRPLVLPSVPGGAPWGRCGGCGC